MKKYLILFLLGIVSVTGFAQTDTLDDDLFGGSEPLVEEAEETEHALDEILLTDDKGVVIGGSFSLSSSVGGSIDLAEVFEWESITWNLRPSLTGALFFDARPSSDIRIFGKAGISYPFSVKPDDEDTPVDESRDFNDIIKIRELFSDFNINNSVFFRVGKQTINWGVGYFFSPADLLSLTDIDPENPDIELLGPLSVKINVPVDMHNIYLYSVIPEDIVDPSDLIWAPKAEFILGKVEIGIGGYYRYKQAPAGMLTITGNISDFSLFGEAVVKYGSDKNFIIEETGTYGLESYNERFFFHGTAGAGYFWNAEEGDLSINTTMQYYFNGEGYEDPDLINSITNLQMALLFNDGLYINDLKDRSLHYGAVNLIVSPLKEFSFSLFWMGNFGDYSGLIRPGITWNPVDYVRAAVSFSYNYGEEGDEYTPQGENMMFSVNISLGGSAF